MSRLLMLGAGGQGKSACTIAKDCGFEVAFLDNSIKGDILGCPLLGGFEFCDMLKGKFDYAFCAIGDNDLREYWIKRLKKAGFLLPVLRCPSAKISLNASIGEGSIIHSQCFIGSCSIIGDGCIINSHAVIEHDCIIDDFVHLAPSATLCGNAFIGKSTFIGAGATVINKIKIGEDVLIAAGAVVIADIENACMAAGVPAKIKRTHLLF